MSLSHLSVLAVDRRKHSILSVCNSVDRNEGCHDRDENRIGVLVLASLDHNNHMCFNYIPPSLLGISITFTTDMMSTDNIYSVRAVKNSRDP
jgi:hypothetical protein